MSAFNAASSLFMQDNGIQFLCLGSCYIYVQAILCDILTVHCSIFFAKEKCQVIKDFYKLFAVGKRISQSSNSDCSSV